MLREANLSSGGALKQIAISDYPSHGKAGPSNKRSFA